MVADARALPMRVVAVAGLTLCLLAHLADAATSRRSILVAYDDSLRPAAYGAEKLRAALLRAGADVHVTTALPVTSGPATAEVVVALQREKAGETETPVEGAFSIELDRASRNGTLRVAAVDGAGAMYACLELAERLDTHMLQLDGATATGLIWEDFVDSLPLPLTVAPRFDYRALKFNLPWSAYRPGNATVTHSLPVSASASASVSVSASHTRRVAGARSQGARRRLRGAGGRAASRRQRLRRADCDGRPL